MILDELKAEGSATDIFGANSDLEYNIAQLKTLGRKYFTYRFSPKENISLFLKNAEKYFDVTRNTPHNEFLIRFNEAPFFWMFDSQLLRFIRSFYKINQRAKTQSNSLFSFMEYYEKWLKAKNEEEREYFAGAAVGLLERRNLSQNFFLQLLLATIKIFDPTYKDPKKAVEILDFASEIVANLNLSIEIRDELNYYIKIYAGFAQVRSSDYENAVISFGNALINKADGINAKYYLAISELKLFNLDAAIKLIIDLYDTDIERIKYSMDSDKELLYNSFCENNIIQNVLINDEFSHVVVEIQQELSARISEAEMIFESLKSKLIEYSHINNFILKDQKDNASLQMLDRIVHKNVNSNNLGFLSSLPFLEEKFYNTIRNIIAKIENKFEIEIQGKLETYDKMMAECVDTIAHLKNETENAKGNAKIKIDKAINELNEKLSNTILLQEERLKQLEFQNDLNPIVTFKNGMSYNVFISVIVLLVVGFASYSNNYISELSDVRSIVSSVVLTGTKWGILTFVVGMLFSALQSGSTVLERNFKKQQIINKIQQLKDQKERELVRARKEGEELEKMMVNKIFEKIHIHEARIESLKKERQLEEVAIRKSFEEQITEETKELKKLLGKP